MTEADSKTVDVKTVKLCEICGTNPSKYRCPGCEQRTCSLPCVNKHKTNSGCDGKRNKTAFVPMKCFSDRDLLSDYRFLEDGGRKSQGCRRDFLKMKHDKPKALIKLVRHAESQGIEMRTMPYPMSKRKNNRTFFLYRSKEILWQIEWIFPQADTKFIDKKQNQNITLETLLKKFIHPTESDPLVRHQLQHYVSAGLAGCRLLMKAEGRSASDVRYHELDGSKSILENLRGKCIVEYPSILVVLSPQCQLYNLLSKEEEDKLWQERRKGNFSRQRNFSPYQQKNVHQITRQQQSSENFTDNGELRDCHTNNDMAQDVPQDGEVRDCHGNGDVAQNFPQDGEVRDCHGNSNVAGQTLKLVPTVADQLQG